MLRISFTALFLGGMLSLSGAVAQAEDSSWGLPNLNPFASKGRPPTASRSAGSSKNSWKLPSLWSAAPATTRNQRRNPPTTLNKMTTGTKNFLNKTADALSPWDNPDAGAKPKPPGVTGSNTLFTHNAPKKATPKSDQTSSSILPTGWWTGDKQADKPKSVNEFLARPKPQ